MSANASNEDPYQAADAFADEPPLPRRSPEAAGRRSALMAAATAAGHERAAADRTAAARRARVAAAAGLPAVLIAATGVALMPSTASAANTAAAGTSAACPAGQAASPVKGAAVVPNAATHGANPTTAPKTAAKPARTKPATAPTGAVTKAVPAVPHATSGAAPTTAPSGSATKPAGQPAAPASSPSSAPTSAASKPSSSPSPSPSSSSPTPVWWDPLTWLGATAPSAMIFNPQPAAGGGPKAAAVNRLGSSQQANPAVVAALNATSDPTPAPSSAPSAPSTDPSAPAASSEPSTPTPTSPPSSPAPSGSASSPASSASSASSAPSSSSSPSGTASAPVTAPTSVCVKPMLAGAAAEAKWHLDSTKLTLYFLTYNGIVTINTVDGPVNVLDFTAQSADVDSMVTYAPNPANGKNDYSNGGSGKTVHLTNVHLHVLKQTGNLLGVVPVTLAPGSADMALLKLTQGIPLPIAWFTDTHVDQYTLTADTLSIPGFDVHQDK